MQKALLFKEYGKPGEILEYTSIAVPKPGNREVLLRQEAVGISAFDCKILQQQAPDLVPSLPAIPCLTAAGIVQEVGNQASHFKVGDRVIYTTIPAIGACQQYRAIHEDYLISLPKDIDYDIAAAFFFQGMVAHMLTQQVFRAHLGHAVLVHDADSDIGQILCHYLMQNNALVIGVVSNPEGHQRAASAGAYFTLDYSDQNWSDKVLEYTKNIGVSAVYDSIGKDVFDNSIKCLKPLGILIMYDQRTGWYPAIKNDVLRSKSLYCTYPNFFHYKSNRNELLISALEVLSSISTMGFSYKTYKMPEYILAFSDFDASIINGVYGAILPF